MNFYNLRFGGFIMIGFALIHFIVNYFIDKKFAKRLQGPYGYIGKIGARIMEIILIVGGIIAIIKG